MNLYQNDLTEMLDRDRDNQTAWDYYEGGVPEFFSTAAIRRAVRSTVRNIGLNYSRTVVREMQNRLEVTAIQGSTATAKKIIKEIDETNNLDVFFDELFEKALVYGEAFAVVWPDSDGVWRLSSHSPRNFYVKYSAENPWEMEYAFRIWQHDEQEVRMNVFRKDTITKYSAKAIGFSDALNWSQTEVLDNPFDEIPVFHFRNDGKNGRPEHKDAYAPQDAINKLVMNHMYTVDYQGAPQRYALANADATGESEDFDESDVERSNVEALNGDAGELWYLKGINNVGEFTAADPQVFWEPIKDNVRAMASMTGTPLHYFENGMVQSGQGLRAAEAPLITKVKKRRSAFGLSVKKMFEFVLRAESVGKWQVEVKWSDLESMDELEQWDLYLKKRNVGLPIRQILIEEGYTEQEIDQIFVWKLEESKQLGQVTDYQRKPQVRVQEDNDENNAESGAEDEQQPEE